MISAGDQPWIIPGFGLEKLHTVEQTEGETETEDVLFNGQTLFFFKVFGALNSFYY